MKKNSKKSIFLKVLGNKEEQAWEKVTSKKRDLRDKVARNHNVLL